MGHSNVNNALKFFKNIPENRSNLNRGSGVGALFGAIASLYLIFQYYHQVFDNQPGMPESDKVEAAVELMLVLIIVGSVAGTKIYNRLQPKDELQSSENETRINSLD